MSAEVRLTITRGLSEGKVFVFHELAAGSIGRGDDCLLRLPSNLAHMDVSRHHCLLAIEPPSIRVRDLGSRNGTYVNGANIGQRPRGLTPEAALAVELPERVLEEGDELRVGGTIFRVSIRGEATATGSEAAVTGGVLVG